MDKIEEILKKIEKLYERTKHETVADVPLVLLAGELAAFARDYISAASILERESPEHWLPILQLTGHAVELSLKACLASAGTVPPVGHDLVELYRGAEARGFALNEPQFAAIVHLRHFYFEDLATGTRYKARYPTTHRRSVPLLRKIGHGCPGYPRRKKEGARQVLKMPSALDGLRVRCSTNWS
jgi:HEPN domain-containing protein